MSNIPPSATNEPTLLTLTNIPLSIVNRVLELYREPGEPNLAAALDALASAESRKDVRADVPGITPFAQAVAEYLSLSGPWAPDGEYSGQGGYAVEPNRSVLT